MKIKKFSQYIAEGGQPSADFVAPKDDDKEVKGYKPRAKGEQEFADKHSAIDKHDYPVDVDGQFTGNIKGDAEGHTGGKKHAEGEKATKQGSSDVSQPNGGGDSARSADKKQGDMKPVNPIKEEVDLTEGKVMDALEKIVKTKGAGSVKFSNGKTLKVDMQTANAMLNMHKKLNDKNKEKMADKIEQSPEVFMKLMDVAFGGK
jgi:hypothetical protein